MPWMHETGRGRDLLNLAVITDREVQSLLWQRGEATTAAAYVAASIILSLAALLAGMATVRGLV